jgi:hypothetical protein
MFVVTNVESSKPLLDEMRSLIGVGNVYLVKRQTKESWQNVCQYRVQGLKDCQKVAELFQPLTFHTLKGEDFKLWGECLQLIQSNEHLTKEGILKICGLREQMNFRKTKNKWSIEDVKRIIAENPNHFVAHFDPNQEKLIHNKEGSFTNNLKWLESKQGNTQPTRKINSL